MPRDGSGIYTLPAGLPSNGDTSDVADIVTPFEDLETDMNTVRPIVAGGTGASSASAARTALGLEIGVNVQAYDADLTSWAGVTRASGFDTFAATPSSANLRSLLTDEVGTGAAYFVGGALGTPASATLTNATGLPPATGLAWTARGRLLRGGAAAWEELALGTSGFTLQSNGTDAVWAFPTVQTAVVTANTSSGVDGAAFPTGSFSALTLNTEQSDASSLVSLSSNKITFATAGTYLIQASVACYNGSGSGRQAQLRLQNVTAGTTISTGQTGSSQTAAMYTLNVSGVATVSASDQVELQGRANGTGLLQCVAAGFGTETGATVTILRIA